LTKTYFDKRESNDIGRGKCNNWCWV